MKNKYLLKLKKEEEKREQEICRVKIEENITNVEAGKELTIPLAILNKNCNFRKIWNKEYRNRPDIKERLNAYQRAYAKKPEQVAKRRAYFSRPEVKAKLKEYYSRPEVKLKLKEYLKNYRKDYYLKNKEKILAKNKLNREKIKGYRRNYYLKNKEKILAKNKLNREKIKEYHRNYYINQLKKENGK